MCLYCKRIRELAFPGSRITAVWYQSQMQSRKTRWWRLIGMTTRDLVRGWGMVPLSGPSRSVRHMWLSNKCCFEYNAWQFSDASHSWNILSNITFTSSVFLDDAWRMAWPCIFVCHTRFSPACVSLIFRWLTVNWTAPKWEERGRDLACANNDTSSYLQV